MYEVEAKKAPPPQDILGVSSQQGWKLEELKARTGLYGGCITGVASTVDQTARGPDVALYTQSRALDPDSLSFIPNMACKSKRVGVGTSFKPARNERRAAS